VEIPSNRYYLVRHGETESNRNRIVMGALDVPLNETGRQQAQRLAPAFADLALDGAFCSSLSRARETAEIILAGRGLRAAELDGLREQDYGEWEGQAFEALAREERLDAQRYYSDPSSVVIPGGEPFHDFCDRVIRTFEHDVRSDGAGKRILVAAHGGSLRVLIAHLLGIPLSTVFFRLWLDNGSVTRIDQLESGHTILKRYNWTPGTNDRL
jgi:broad specificity phosphatase PhoE